MKLTECLRGIPGILSQLWIWILLIYILQEGPPLPLRPPEPEDSNSYILSPHKWCSKPTKDEPSTHSMERGEPPLALLTCLGPSGPCSRLSASLEEWGVPFQLHKYSKGLIHILKSGFNPEKGNSGRLKAKKPFSSQKFNIIIFQDPEVYLSLSDNEKKAIGGLKLLMFNSFGAPKETPMVLPDNSSIVFKPHSYLRNLRLGGNHSYQILKSNRVFYETLDPSDFSSLSFIGGLSTDVLLEAESADRGAASLVVRRGKSVIFGCNPLDHWLTKILAMEALFQLCSYSINPSRSVLIDIDDIFVGKNRLTTEDVDALITSQARIRQNFIRGFTYNLGFSGGTYGLPSYTLPQREGDEALLKKGRDAFWWFPHTFKHLQPHLFNSSSVLIRQMTLNHNFASSHGLSVPFSYAVAPHHSGVYPVHPPLYKAWKTVWNISVTCTEEYPHLKPARSRRGFIFGGIMILPRQTCGLFTKNIYYYDYPRSPEVLERSLKGGELFNTLIVNPFNVYMSHMPNYAFDRLAPYAFESVFSMVQCWTKLELKTDGPERMAKEYFERFSEDKVPLWGNPCSDPRHAEIVHAPQDGSDCSPPLPHFLILGPQKTGSTALLTFLKIHPGLHPNNPHPSTFEELQFFSRESEYALGIHHYSSFWSHSPTGSSGLKRFEKSATYFDKELAPLRAFSLLPRSKIIVLIISPLKRALSWYHHARAHGDATALNHTFFQVLNDTSTSRLRGLRSRILEPGKYALHLRRWLKYYHENDLLILDGEKLRYSAGTAMNTVQRFLDLKVRLDYEKELVYDPKKGFYCQMLPEGRTKCLGKNKGRSYPPMDDASKAYLKKYYRPFNEDLKALLYHLDFSIPYWLLEDLEID